VRTYTTSSSPFTPHAVLSDLLDRLRPLRSVFHDSWGAPEPCQDGVHQETITQIIEWMNQSSENDDHPMVFWLFDDDRSETSAVARSVAIQARGEGRLVSSFFFPWSGKQEDRDPTNLIPTVTYKLAQNDSDVLRKVTESIIANPDVRDQEASMQIALLLKRPLMDPTVLSSFDSPRLIVIDALDTCNDLIDPQIASAIGLFIQCLTSKPMRIKVLLTSRFPRAIRHIVDGQNFPVYHQLALPHQVKATRTRTVPAARLPDHDNGE
jgi:hypothetical protein